MNNPVGWFEIYVADLRRARTFYEQVFGIELSRLDAPAMDMLGFPMEHGAAGAPGALVHMPGFTPAGNSVLVYFSCQDCAVQAQMAEQSGGRVQKPKTAIGQYGHIALVIDTEGNMIGLHSQQ